MQINKEYNQEYTMKQKNNVAVIIPCYNAGNRLEKVIKAVTIFPADIYIVDDGSTDNCIASVLNMPVSVISFPVNKGKGFAIIEGLKHVLNLPQYEIVCFMDADGQHAPELLPLFIEKWKENKADIIIGQRDLSPEKTPLPSKLGNYITQYLLRILAKCPLSDTQCGFRLYSRSFAQEIIEKIPPGRYETETWILLLALKQKRNIGTIPIPSIYEEKNRSSHFRKFYDSFRILKTILYFIFTKRSDKK
ncbi:MAG: glycosyltransferase family 2 protein [Candidatus Hydrogenedens sp.]